MNKDFFTYIEDCLNEETLPHAFLVETSNVSKAVEELVIFLNHKKILKKEIAINNLNLVMIEPDGKEIKSAEIDNLKIRFATIPVYDKYNVYIIKEAEKMNISSSNKLLKFLEEPTDFILGFLIINKDKELLETIKSRCQVFKLEFEDPNNYLNEQTIEIIDFLENQSYSREIELRKILSDLERTDLITIIDNCLIKLSNKLAKDEQFTITISSNLILLDNLLRLLKSNVNIELVLDKLFIEAR